MDDRAELRKCLESLRELVQSPGPDDLMRSVANMGEFYWTLQLLAELRTGKTVDKILCDLDDTQVVNARRALDHTFRFVCYVIAMGCLVADAAGQVVTKLQHQPHQNDNA